MVRRIRDSSDEEDDDDEEVEEQDEEEEDEGSGDDEGGDDDDNEEEEEDDDDDEEYEDPSDAEYEEEAPAKKAKKEAPVSASKGKSPAPAKPAPASKGKATAAAPSKATSSRGGGSSSSRGKAANEVDDKDAARLNAKARAIDVIRNDRAPGYEYSQLNPCKDLRQLAKEGGSVDVQKRAKGNSGKQKCARRSRGRTSLPAPSRPHRACVRPSASQDSVRATDQDGATRMRRTNSRPRIGQRDQWPDDVHCPAAVGTCSRSPASSRQWAAGRSARSRSSTRPIPRSTLTGPARGSCGCAGRSSTRRRA